MNPVTIVLTGKGLLTALGLLALALGVLALVWWLAGPGYALLGGLGLVLLVKGLFALLKPAE
ncbi:MULTISPECIES: hypothetical protein [Saccharopolyspora]|uniref:MYXO-CTERM domain-containing protein n=1 Tax=Saccharopolyspora cebuensis TaxID=418759 RepID=A0ABV4CKC8_9PSEU